MSLVELKYAIVSDRMRELLPEKAHGPSTQGDYVLHGTMHVDPELWQRSTISADGPLFRHYTHSDRGAYYILREFAYLYTDP